MSRYHWSSFDGERDAFDEGYHDRYARNPHGEHGSYAEEQRHRAFDDGQAEHRREEERCQEDAEEERREEARTRRRAEEHALEDAAYEQQEYPEPPPEPEPTDEEPQS